MGRRASGGSEVKPLSTIRKAADALAIKYAAAVQHEAAEFLGVTTAQEGYKNALDARRIAQEIAKRTQTEAATPIVQIVNQCLSSVFPDHYTFGIVFEARRGKTEVDLVMRKGAYSLDPMGAVGGGVLDVASLGIRLAVLMLTVPRVQRVLVLDEPLKNLQPPRIPLMRVLLQKIVDEMGIQVICTTPIGPMVMGNVISIGDD